MNSYEKLCFSLLDLLSTSFYVIYSTVVGGLRGAYQGFTQGVGEAKLRPTYVARFVAADVVEAPTFEWPVQTQDPNISVEDENDVEEAALEAIPAESWEPIWEGEASLAPATEDMAITAGLEEALEELYSGESFAIRQFVAVEQAIGGDNLAVEALEIDGETGFLVDDDDCSLSSTRGFIFVANPGRHIDDATSEEVVRPGEDIEAIILAEVGMAQKIQGLSSELRAALKDDACNFIAKLGIVDKVFKADEATFEVAYRFAHMAHLLCSQGRNAELPDLYQEVSGLLGSLGWQVEPTEIAALL